MTLRINLLSAAALLALPLAAGAQVTGSRVNPGVNPAAQAERDRAADARAAAGEADVESAAEAEAETEADANSDSAQGPAADADVGATELANAADIRAGAVVRDTEGGLVGTIESVDADGAVVATGSVRAKLPFGSFGKNARGLVISLTRSELEAAARAQNPG